MDNTPYTLTYTIQRLTDTSTRISTSVTGGALKDLNYTATESSSSPNTAFDYFAFRFGGTNLTTGITFTMVSRSSSTAADIPITTTTPMTITMQIPTPATIAAGSMLEFARTTIIENV